MEITNMGIKPITELKDSGLDETIKLVGKKHDEGKNKIGMVFSYFAKALDLVGYVGTFGNKKYGNGFHDYNWDKVPDCKERYLDALFRHLSLHIQGIKKDSESGRPHLAHAAWNVLALLEMEARENV